MPETTDYQRFKLCVARSKDRLDRVENVVLAGMPDVNFCADGVECWIEFKSPTEPKRASTPLFGSNHKISIDQRNWFVRHLQAGGRGFFLIVTEQRWMLVHGAMMDELNSMTVAEIERVALWRAAKPIMEKSSWLSLRAALLRH